MAITLSDVYVDSTNENIQINVTTDVGSLFTTLHFWTTDTYKVVADKVDLTSSLIGTINAESLTISLADVGLTTFNGIFFLEITDDGVGNGGTPLVKEAVTANLTDLVNCQMENILSSKIEGCTITLLNTDCGNDSDTLFFIESLLSALGTSLKLGNYTESIRIYDSIVALCTNCFCYSETVLDENFTGYKFDNDILIAY